MSLAASLKPQKRLYLLISVPLITMLLTFPLLWGWSLTLLDEDIRPNNSFLGTPNISEQENLNYTSYLPVTMSIVPQWYASARRPDSLSMMLQPREYRRMTCAQLRTQHQREFDIVSGRNKFRKNQETDPRTLLFRDPHPVCGRYLLSRLTGGKHRYVFVVRTGRSQASQLPSVLTVRAGDWSEDIVIEQCGQCMEAVASDADACSEDVLFRARLFNANRVLDAEVVPPGGGGAAQDGHGRVARVVRFRPLDPGDYTLEVKMVHYNGNSDNYKRCRNLGRIGLHYTSKYRNFFFYNGVCDVQRLVYGSPLRVRVLPAVDVPTLHVTPPFCNISTNYNTSEGGQWVRFVDGADPHTPEGAPHPLAANCTAGDRYCHGNPVSLTDPGGYNNHLVWVPSTCRLRLFAKGTGGPSTVCLRTPSFRTRQTEILFAGDSMAREHYSNCEETLSNRSNSLLRCRRIEFLVKAKRYTRASALLRVNAALDTVNDATVFVTNMGMQYMVTEGTKTQWVEFVDLFVREWRRRNLTVLRGPYTTMPPFGAPATVEAPGDAEWQQYMWEQNQRSRAIMRSAAGEHSRFPPHVEWAVWLSPPTVQYAHSGMTHQREVEWDRLAYERLQKIGFIRLDALTPTHSRQEGTWDGLHYLPRANAAMSPRRNPRAAVQEFNGGVSFMLFLILLNVVCFS
ncbi:putative GPI-anchored surface protein [Trypanosoma theileri]|uniref:Putative GPI-anchored surface protein n=1 Tax=Trypanosoma theileri TaxID=67003 RepID=A0A1X0P8Y8_9TRYP|nr:putative GPI-anchored surface protein [Trypanosoma theileri]ORC93386.1 putative GPI-anchored surface protein [Trypanosoma theileri]